MFDPKRVLKFRRRNYREIFEANWLETGSLSPIDGKLDILNKM
jgi:hypothetical protein